MEYRGSVRDDIQVLLDRYTYVDAAIKVVGVGSVGTRCVIVLMQGADENDLLFLQVKQAGTSVLEPYLAASQYAHSGSELWQGSASCNRRATPFLAGRRGHWATTITGASCETGRAPRMLRR